MPQIRIKTIVNTYKTILSLFILAVWTGQSMAADWPHWGARMPISRCLTRESFSRTRRRLFASSGRKRSVRAIRLLLLLRL
jgi:hypothetical protein